ncbi:serine/threonine-protein kinase [Synechococcus sp. Cruz CV-v-12]|uniref:serine/threonine-protein kinase n=1 Tax=Synechococcus sp. Cruz CV-v-12 TaxID=2823728 RepID=UPI0020CE87AD|nr:serine/threonine-protein kinase [Synechococcus sp. Cruz CV-v-12]MCP9874375.1 serine/threonine protein kinase [Synechococcus sp. Cruz CV-v-12]
MTLQSSNIDDDSSVTDAVGAVRMLWSAASPPGIDDVLTPAVLEGAAGDGSLLAEVISEDIEQRRRRGLPCGLAAYRQHWPVIVSSGPVRRAVLVGEFIERSSVAEPGWLERVRVELHDRHPELRADIDTVATIALVVQGDDLLHASRHGPGSRVGKYRLDELLGAGAFAHTWLAWDEQLHRHVALKLLRAGDKGDAARPESVHERVLSEAAAAAGLDHPAIVRVHEAGHIDGVGFIDAQFIGSIDAHDRSAGAADSHHMRAVSRTAERLLGDGPLTPEHAARLICVITGAVAAAHARGITHRDIKPANILLTPAGEPMLADFGLAATEAARGQNDRADRDQPMPLAASAPADQPARRRIAGTPAYLAPEVARGEAATPLSDVFALGCTLRALLTGEPTRSGSVGVGAGVSMADLLARIGCEPLTPLAGARPTVPLTLARIADRATAHEPAARYTSADRLAADLQAFLEHRPVEADPRGPVHVAGLWMRRHRTGVLVSTSLVLIVGVLAFAFISRIADERNRAIAAERLAETRRDEAIAANNTIIQMNRFVSRMFNSTRGQRDSAEFTVIDAIRLGAGRVERTFADRPLAAAAVQHFLGQAASNSGDFDTARKQLGAALETRRRLLGPTHPDTISTLRQWGEMLNVSGQKAESAEVFAEIVRLLGEDAALTSADGLYALAQVGGAATSRRDFVDARRLLERVADAYTRWPGDGSADHQNALNRLVTLYLATREYGLAERTQRQIVAINTRLLGADDISTINSLTTVGFVLREGGKRDESRTVYADAIARYVRVVGESNRYTLNTRLELALTCIPDDPAAALEQVTIVEPHTTALAPNQQNRLKFGWVRGQALVAAGRPDDAVIGLQHAFESALAAVGSKDVWTRRTAALLAGTLEKLGRKGEAAAVRAKAAPSPAPLPTKPATTPPGDPSDAD